MSFSSMLRQFSIRTRMIGAIVMVLSLLTIVGGVGLVGINALRDQTRHLAENTVTRANQLTHLVDALSDLRRAEKDMIIKYESPAEASKEMANWEAARQTIMKLAGQIGSGDKNRTGDLLGQLSTHLDAYASKAQPVLQKLGQGGFDNAAAANKELTDAKESVRKVESIVADARKAFEKTALESQQKSEGTENTTMSVFIGVLIVSAVIVVPLTLLNMVSICKPLADAEDLARAIAGGDLTSHAMAIEGNDEASHLMHSLQNMQQSLQALVGQLRTSADSIRTASVEIASGNQDLSGRTEQTASNLQLAASSMVQLTGTVKQTADSARTANQLATSASNAAAKGGEVVGQVVSTMDEINTSSKKISDIIGVIDGIAFQTNILALNAAVEAARAGEQGRGFAVVAGEVRSLAQRSAEAAREIKTLIGASVERVEIGARLVQDAGTSMTEIVTSVQRVSDIIGEITAAASEQSDGIGQVNQSVVQLDQMTQQNAALVEESAAAAESLKDQAERLAQAVDRFRISNTSGSPVNSPQQGGVKSGSMMVKPASKPASASGINHTATASSKRPSSTPSAKPAGSGAPHAPRPAPAPAPAKASTETAEGDWETF